MTVANLLTEVSRPDCSPEVLRAALFMVNVSSLNAEMRAAILRNPNLPADLLANQLRDGWEDAWLNPAVELHLLNHPQPPGSEIEEGLCLAAWRVTTGKRETGGQWPYSRRLRSHPEILQGRRGPFWDRWLPWLRAIAERTP